MNRAEALRAASAVVVLIATGCASAGAAEVRIGALMGVTGPVANFVPPILDAFRLAVRHVDEQGGILGGRLGFVVADDQDRPEAAAAAAAGLVADEKVTAIVGPLTGRATIAASAVTAPAGVLTISPTATDARISTLDDGDTLFRVTPSDAYQGKALARLVLRQGLRRVALTFGDNDNLAAIARAFRETYERLGGTVTADRAHEEKKASYREEIEALARGEPEALVLVAYAAESGIAIIREALAEGLFRRFAGTEGLKDNLLVEQLDADSLATIFLAAPSAPPPTTATARFDELYAAAYGATADKFFAAQTYDATFLVALAIAAAGSTDRKAVRDALRSVANAPGEPVEPGEWRKALALLAAGRDIDYRGASGPIEFDARGDVPGVVGHWIARPDGFEEVGLVPP